MDLGRLKQQSGDTAVATLEIKRSLQFNEQVLGLKPGNTDSLSNIAVGFARLGSILAEQGKAADSLASYRKGVSVLEELDRQHPGHNQIRRDLMLAHSHVGDQLKVSGEIGAAVEAFQKMEEIARGLYDADHEDVRGISDYGIALMRLGVVTPEAGVKTATLEKAHEMLAQAAKKSSKDVTNAANKAWAEVELGNAYLAAGKQPAAMQSYRAAIASAEFTRTLDPKDNQAQGQLVAGARKLAEELASNGDRSGALLSLEKALELARGIESNAGSTSFLRRAHVARAWIAAGSVYGRLAVTERGGQRLPDLAAARDWYQRGLSEWRKLESQKGVGPRYRLEIDAATKALAALPQ